ncbi:MAG: transporter permease [Paenibacillus sp.]|jgi:putative aldouronate transport system permease protein|nr:transporter permease [Paenibacillus sp.]
MKTAWGDRLFETFNIGFLAAVGLAMLFPIYYTVALSFMDPTEYYQGKLTLFPSKWTLEAYRYLLSTRTFMNAIGVSLFLATVGTMLSLVVTSGLSYMLSRKRLRFRRPMMFLILMTILFSPGLIPTYLVVRELGLLNSVWSLIIPSLTGGWYVLLMKGFFDSIPDSLEDAARIDGCNEIGIWLKIILPLSMPAMAAFGLFYAVGYWNTFFNAVMYISDHTKWPLQVLLRNMLTDPSSAMSGDGLQQMREDAIKMPSETLKMAAVVITSLPIMLVYPFLQKHFAKGALVGSVKE